MKMKSAFISSIFCVWAKINKNVDVFVTHGVVDGPLDTTWHFIQLELQIYVLNVKKNMSWQMKLQDLMV